MGAFGLNASIMDSANLGWKLGLVAKNEAKLETLMPTYTDERRDHAVRVIRTSGKYLRFVCRSDVDLPNFHDLETQNGQNGWGAQKNGTANGLNAATPQKLKISQEDDLKFLADFFKENGQFLLGVDCLYRESVLTPATGDLNGKLLPPLRVKNGVRAPNIRVCFSADQTGYLYDKLAGPPRFHLLLFLSSLSGREVRRQATEFTQGLRQYHDRFGGSQRFNIVVVLKCFPFELETKQQSTGLDPLWQQATILFDDRAPDEDAHTAWGANHTTGALAVVRPDLWVGMTAFPSETEKITSYFEGFLLPRP